jgi:hypothetical protein
MLYIDLFDAPKNLHIDVISCGLFWPAFSYFNFFLNEEHTLPNHHQMRQRTFAQGWLKEGSVCKNEDMLTKRKSIN